MTIVKPKTAKEFSEKWDIPNPAVLVNGDADFPNMYHRQDRLVGQVLDACVVLHVSERMKEGTHFKELDFFFPEKFPEAEFNKIKNLPDEDRLKTLVGMVQNKQSSNKIRLMNHYDLVEAKDWQKYTAAFQKHLKAYDAWKKDIENSYHGNSYIPKRPAMPADPRVPAINEMILPTIQILNCGPKGIAAIGEKAKRKNVDICELRDVNRIGVLPKKPEYAENFIKIMALMNPPKTVGKDVEIPRFFEEPPEIFSNGYYNQKLVVALDRNSHPTDKTKGNKASIAEIKIVPAAMLQAEKLTATIKPILDILNNVKHPDFDEEKQEALKYKYNEQKNEFKALTRDMPDKYKWPDLPRELSKDKAYSDLKDEFNILAITINTDAIMSENRGWKEKYLKTALLQHIGKNPNNHEFLINTLPRTDALSGYWLKKIADSDNLSLSTLGKKVGAENMNGKPAKSR
jgi:hypothetical protein